MSKRHKPYQESHEEPHQHYQTINEKNNFDIYSEDRALRSSFSYLFRKQWVVYEIEDIVSLMFKHKSFYTFMGNSEQHSLACK